MTDLGILMLAATAGMVLGAIFFGGLWWTVRRGLTARQPALWFMVSQMLRTAIVVAGFLLVADRHWQRLLACVTGFLVARLIVTWLTRSTPAIAEAKADHAPHA